MDPLVFNQAYALALLAALVAEDGLLDGAVCALGQADIVPTPATPLASYTIATYTGYGTEAITWLAPSVSDDGTPEVVGTVGEFRPTGTTVGNQIYTLQITNTGGTVLLAAARFTLAPVPMVSTLDSILPTIRIRATPAGLVAVVT